MSNRKIVTHPVEFYKSIWNGRSLRREWRWRIKASNGRIIAASSESYVNKADCIYNAKSTSKSINSHFRNNNA